jgi:hypothetical protein
LSRSPKYRWVFWFRQQRAPGNKITNYEEGIKKISAFASVESFWSLWTHLHPPSALLPTTDYLLFHQGVRRPVWEDPLNLPGGKWILRLRKGVADRIWEDLVLALIGDQFAGVASPHDDEWPEICGCTISVRQNEDILSVWNRVDEPKLRERVRCDSSGHLFFSSLTSVRWVTVGEIGIGYASSYISRRQPSWSTSLTTVRPRTLFRLYLPLLRQSFVDSMADKSSFRNSTIDRSPLS